MKGHPVDLFFPPGPIPPAHAVIEGAVVEVIAVLVGRADSDLCFYRREVGGEAEVGAIPGDLAMAKVFQIVIQGGGDGDTGVATEDDLFAAAFEFEAVFAGRGEAFDDEG